LDGEYIVKWFVLGVWKSTFLWEKVDIFFVLVGVVYLEGLLFRMGAKNSHDKLVEDSGDEDVVDGVGGDHLVDAMEIYGRNKCYERDIQKELCENLGVGEKRALVKWLKENHNGERTGLFMIGVLSESVYDDKDVALEWYYRAADAGYVYAMSRIGDVYFGIGDFGLALEWYGRAVGKGHVGSMHNMGVVYGALGESEKALRWYLKAAEVGYAASMNNLGVLYYVESGRGDVDRVEYVNCAVGWLESAQKRGDRNAGRNLEIAGGKN